jgi:GntR family transcriptional regulator
VADDLDDLSGVPHYLQVSGIIEREIRAGTWQTGSPVPSRIALTQRFGIAQATAGRVHAWLAERGYVVAVPGVGMVVTPRDRWPAVRLDTSTLPVTGRSRPLTTGQRADLAGPGRR